MIQYRGKMVFPMVRLTGDAFLCFNKASLFEYELDNYPFVKVEYSKPRKAIIVNLLQEKKWDTNRLSKHDDSRTICCLTFFKEHPKLIKYLTKNYKVSKERNKLIIDIANPLKGNGRGNDYSAGRGLRIRV